MTLSLLDRFAWRDGVTHTAHGTDEGLSGLITFVLLTFQFGFLLVGMGKRFCRLETQKDKHDSVVCGNKTIHGCPCTNLKGAICMYEEKTVSFGRIYMCMICLLPLSRWIYHVISTSTFWSISVSALWAVFYYETFQSYGCVLLVANRITRNGNLTHKSARACALVSEWFSVCRSSTWIQSYRVIFVQIFGFLRFECALKAQCSELWALRLF